MITYTSTVYSNNLAYNFLMVSRSLVLTLNFEMVLYKSVNQEAMMRMEAEMARASTQAPPAAPPAPPAAEAQAAAVAAASATCPMNDTIASSSSMSNLAVDSSFHMDVTEDSVVGGGGNAGGFDFGGNSFGGGGGSGFGLFGGGGGDGQDGANGGGGVGGGFTSFFGAANDKGDGGKDGAKGAEI